ncbi:class I fructose-bisphosphate aldolase [Pseudonocardia endophytica]|uniref:fructose-bisphosphate aldolase n=1 Tax=Pseudonocardia endophytica TaxID=401976 RepID=A0A4R1HK89_PSEEN|nr:class I fructose-bisphosphate aldolase [Pseudonocardia endophytica]TCK21333.1 fructose-bisphosphate aldolase class I [Pseudonocardia endophytica]
MRESTHRGDGPGPGSATAPAALFADARGILLLDQERELSRRLRRHGIPGKPSLRDGYHELLLGAEGLCEHVAAVQLSVEQLDRLAGRDTPAGLLFGARADRGVQPLRGHSGESVTRGLENLGPRLEHLASAGASYASWRGVFVISEGRGRATPSPTVVGVNTATMARFARACLGAGLVPLLIVDVLTDGHHDVWRCAEVIGSLLGDLFDAIAAHDVGASQVALVTCVAIEGAGGATRAEPSEVAAATATALRNVPVDPGAVGFLCGSVPFKRFARNLDALRALRSPRPGFAIGRALTDPVLAQWRGDRGREASARTVLLDRLRTLHAVGGGDPAPWPGTTADDRVGRSLR